MKRFAAFFQLVRWQNLGFIVLTQVLFYFCIYKSLYKNPESYGSLIGLVIASVLIAAAGYIINDYFDLNIDQINKPQKNVINREISRRWAIIFHLVLSVLGIGVTILSGSFHKWYLAIANTVCVILLWLYSTSFKRQAIIGNVIISLLTAWTVLVIFFLKVPFSAAFGNSDMQTARFFRLAFLYGGFAFVISLIREAVKDVQDMEGDARYGCKTLPIVAGVRATKIYTAVWVVVLIASLVVLQLYVLQFRWWGAILYSLVTVITPLFYFAHRLRTAVSPAHFAYLSRLSKWIMLTGILSMLFFRLYF